MTDFDGFDAFKRDDDLEAKTGVDLKFPGGQIITILRAGGANRKYLRTFQKATDPYRRQIRMKKLDDETNDSIMREVYADSVIIGWSGITAGGKPVPFTRENVIAFLKAFPEVFDEIIERANNLATFHVEQVEEIVEDLGNA